MQTKTTSKTHCNRCGTLARCRKAIKPPFLSQFIPYADRYKDRSRWYITNLCRTCYDRIVSLKELP